MNLEDKITIAQHRIEELYHETEGRCYVSFSGGKDSTVLLALVKMCEELYTIPQNAIPAVYANTGIEMGVTIEFVKWVKDNWYPNVIVIRPEKSFDWVVKNRGKPLKSKIKSKDLRQYLFGQRTDKITRLMTDGRTGGDDESGRLSLKHKIADKDMHMMHDDFQIVPSYKCCDYMKKKPFEKYAKEFGMRGNAQGVRTGEGGARDSAANVRVSKGGKLCTWVKHGIIQKAPIIDWSEKDVDEFVDHYNVPLSDAYTKYGFDRTGCMGCPYAKHIDKQLEYLYFHEQNRYKASMHWLKDVYIAQNVFLPFDEEYEAERSYIWRTRYEPMRQEMLRKYRPNSRLIKDSEQLSMFEILENEGRYAQGCEQNLVISDRNDQIEGNDEQIKNI